LEGKEEMHLNTLLNLSYIDQMYCTKYRKSSKKIDMSPTMSRNFRRGFF